LPTAFEEGDLFQDVIVHLVEDDCAVMKAFSGATEPEWLAYLAVTTRSVVCDLLRRQARKNLSGNAISFAKAWWEAQSHKRNQYLGIDANVLAGEVRAICERTIRNLAGKHVERDILIFDLYFFHDLSIAQIAAYIRSEPDC
jgi:DNA-directed RNA polymerase specialized sigma24 family protein